MKIRKSKKMALILSLSLGLTMQVWAATPEEITATVDNSSETGINANATAVGLVLPNLYLEGTSFDIIVKAVAGTDLSGYIDAYAYGVNNAGNFTTENNVITVAALGGKALSTGAHAYGISNFVDTLITKNNTIVVTAIGGEAESTEIISGYLSTYAYAYGINNSATLATGDNTITVTATGGKASPASLATVMATAFGIFNSDILTTENNTIVVTVTGGEVGNAASDGTSSYTESYGISNISNLTTGANTITVTTIGGKSVNNGTTGSAINDRAYGIQNFGTMNTKENTIRVIAVGGIAAEGTASAEVAAFGMYSGSSGSLTAVGSQNIYTEAVAGEVNGGTTNTYAYALLAESGGTIMLDSQGEIVQLTGDIGVNLGGIIPTLFQASDDLRIGPGVNLGGSITVSLDNPDSYWRPQFQDTYQSAVNGNFGDGSFTMRDGGVLDVAWHSNLGGFNFKDSQLNLKAGTIVIGDGATFIINSDLANNVADTISADTTATGTHYVQVAYDPSYLTYDTVVGRALVLDFDGANGLGVLSTVETPLQTVTFMPIMDGGYLVGLVTGGNIGEGGQTASDSYQQQINILRTQWSTLVQRLGDVRNENPESHNGSWARIHGGKLKSDGAYGRKSTMKYGGVQAGYDRMRETGSGKYLAGFLVDYMDVDSEFHRGEGNTESLAFGGYWTWLGSKGHYADVVVKATHLDTDYDFYYLNGQKASADFTNWGYTMSVEYGYRHDLRKNRYLEPQAQFLVGHLESKNYRNSNGVNLHQDGVNLALGRVGLLLGWADENKSSAYIRGSLVHDFSGSGALTSSYEGERMRIDTAGNSGTSFEVNMGATVVLGKNSHLYAEMTKGFGGDVKTDWHANVGWRVKW